MCGILGFYSHSKNPEQYLQPMLESMKHRGPDERGVWSEKPMAFGHNRLSIIDLTSNGSQPKASANGRYVLCYNGEMYNFKEIRAEIADSYPFQGHGDTEVLLACFQLWGREKTLEKIQGMYAFALWDREEKSLTLVRDRLGEKPLYYGFVDNSLVFSSEMKPIQKFSSNLDINHDAVALYFRHNYIPSPYSIYKGIYKLRPGHAVVFKENQLENLELPTSSPYWDLGKKLTKNNQLTESQSLIELEKLLLGSIEKQMVSDVPIGCFLSGGVDSSLTTALMQSLSSKPVNSFTIGFHEKDHNEAEFAKEVANHLGTNHHEMYVDGQMCLDVVQQIPHMYDEPFADSSQIPTYLVSKLARQHVTVCLSGDGGDELFGGYNRYFLTDNYWTKINQIPKPLRSAFSFVADSTPPGVINPVYKMLSPMFPKDLRFENPSDKLRKATEAFNTSTILQLYKNLVSHHKDPSSYVLKSQEPPTVLDSKLPDELGSIETMMYLDTLSYLPDDILTKVDRASMAVSLESRVPMLDQSVVEFAWSLPYEHKVKNGVGKSILRDILYKYVPKKLIERPKRGFAIPVDKWIRQDLRELTCDLLHPDKIKKEGILDHNYTSQLLEEHLSGKRNWQYQLWDILIFQLWMQSKN